LFLSEQSVDKMHRFVIQPDQERENPFEFEPGTARAIARWIVQEMTA